MTKAIILISALFFISCGQGAADDKENNTQRERDIQGVEAGAYSGVIADFNGVYEAACVVGTFEEKIIENCEVELTVEQGAGYLKFDYLVYGNGLSLSYSTPRFVINGNSLLLSSDLGIVGLIGDGGFKFRHKEFQLRFVLNGKATKAYFDLKVEASPQGLPEHQVKADFDFN